jgi:predicted dehydrogenase/threonine dehydrogenase-like Zn-dependent dehydrogenase
MKQVLVGQGKASIVNVPSPVVGKGHVLVEVAYSVISSGTEVSGVQNSGKSLVQRVIEQPQNIKKLTDFFREKGLQKTLAKVEEKKSKKEPTGYSCSGIVIAVGEDVEDFQPGDRVACAGAGKANHAEIVLVPKNLVVKIPEGCCLEDAASVTLGSIAMQGVRRTDPKLGETIAVFGLGLLGQLTVQLLKAAGCQVIGLDLDQKRIQTATQSGLDYGFVSHEIDLEKEVLYRTNGKGVDATIIAASSQSNSIVQQAMQITRKKGKIVVVGAVGLGLQRSPFYEKELDFLISCSYGPGRYDPVYEEQGLDYPYAYVRWTEKRNMQAYLRLIAEGKINLKPILETTYHIDDAEKAFQVLNNAADKPLGVIISYDLDSQKATGKFQTKVQLKPHVPNKKVNVALVGAGEFAKAFHLPNLKRLSNLYHIRAIVSTTGSNARLTAEQFNADYATTNYQDVLEDDSVDMVMICTRHNVHAQMAIQAARADKAIFLEKPMALNNDELSELEDVIKETQVTLFMGFNRRYSKASIRAKEIINEHQSPLMIMYRVNAGYIPLEHWIQTDEGGGRIIGEACHMLDLFQYFVSPAKAVEISSMNVSSQVEHISSSDNVVINVKYDDGSVATLLYTALGAKDLPKEYVEIYADGKILIIDDFKELIVKGASLKGWKSPQQDKGHLDEMEVFGQYLLGKGELDISLADLVETTKISISAAEGLQE